MRRVHMQMIVHNLTMRAVYAVFCFLCIVPIVSWAATDGIYTITVDSVGFAGGETSSDGTYGVTDTVGEPIVGVSTDGTLQTQDGVFYQELSAATTTIALSSTEVNLGAVIAGTPNTAELTVTVTTDAPNGYALFVNQNHDMTHTTDASATIPSFATGTIAAPTAWGASVGLGLTLLSGTSIPAAWGTSPNNNYAAIPTVAAALHTKTGYKELPDETVVQYKADVAQAQQSGIYTNTVTYMAVENL